MKTLPLVYPEPACSKPDTRYVGHLEVPDREYKSGQAIYTAEEVLFMAMKLEVLLDSNIRFIVEPIWDAV
jgi:hypothetical protein